MCIRDRSQLQPYHLSSAWSPCKHQKQATLLSYFNKKDLFFTIQYTESKYCIFITVFNTSNIVIVKCSPTFDEYYIYLHYFHFLDFCTTDLYQYDGTSFQDQSQ